MKISRDMVDKSSYKFKILPNDEQRIIITKTFGATRFVHNYFLNLSNEAIEKKGKALSYEYCLNILNKLVIDKDTSWLSEIDSISLNTTLEDLIHNLSIFQISGTNKPSFLYKRNEIQRFRTKNINNSIEIKDNYINIDKIGLIKFENYPVPKGQVVDLEIIKRESMDYFASLNCIS